MDEITPKEWVNRGDKSLNNGATYVVETGPVTVTIRHCYMCLSVIDMKHGEQPKYPGMVILESSGLCYDHYPKQFPLKT